MTNSAPKRDTLAYVEGQLMALSSIVRSVIFTMPDGGEQSIRAAAEGLELLRTAMLPSRMKDEAFEGIDHIQNLVLRAPNTKYGTR